MTSGDLAKDVLEAEEQLEMHQERKAEIDGRHAHYSGLKEHGEDLVEHKHYARYSTRLLAFLRWISDENLNQEKACILS